jgi:hypothetical protein
MQPVDLDAEGVVRFHGNAIVRHLLDVATIGLNEIAALPFEREDHEQLAQLLGYSVDGFCDLPYASEEARERAIALAEELSTGRQKAGRVGWSADTIVFASEEDREEAVALVEALSKALGRDRPEAETLARIEATLLRMERLLARAVPHEGPC